MKLSVFAAAVAALVCSATAQTLDSFPAEVVDSNIIEDEVNAPASGKARQLAVTTTGTCKVKTGTAAGREVDIFARPCHGNPQGFKGDNYDGIRLYIEPSQNLHARLVDPKGNVLTFNTGVEAKSSPAKVTFLGTHKLWDGTWSSVCAGSGCYSLQKNYKSYDAYDVYAEPKGNFVTRFILQASKDCRIVRQYAMDDFRKHECSSISFE